MVVDKSETVDRGHLPVRYRIGDMDMTSASDVPLFRYSRVSRDRNLGPTTVIDERQIVFGSRYETDNMRGGRGCSSVRAFHIF